MFKISKQSDYGLLFLEYLKGKDDFVSLKEIIEKTKLPKRFLARIASKLAQEKIVESKEGKVGGYRLTEKIKKMTLYDYLLLFEDLKITSCVDENFHCPWEKSCQHKNFFNNKLEKIFINSLKKEKLLKII
ncbi:MAG: RrF2 family transcriptional regulator [Microgenomates group bacterium]